MFWGCFRSYDKCKKVSIFLPSPPYCEEFLFYKKKNLANNDLWLQKMDPPRRPFSTQ
jgi:hypothetical protein